MSRKSKKSHVFPTKSHYKAKKPAAPKKNKENPRPNFVNRQDCITNISHPIEKIQDPTIETHISEPTRETGDISAFHPTIEQIEHINSAEPTMYTSITPPSSTPASVQVHEHVEYNSSISTSSDESDESEHPLSPRSDTSASDDGPVKDDDIERILGTKVLVKGETEDNLAMSTMKSELDQTALTVSIAQDTTKVLPASRAQGVSSSVHVRIDDADLFASTPAHKPSSIVFLNIPAVSSIRQIIEPVNVIQDQPEQVPAYATRSHAAWFSNPANKIVRGVYMGTPRTVTELQRISRVRTVTPNLNSTTTGQPAKVAPAAISSLAEGLPMR
jgi:hypothetical protein